MTETPLPYERWIEQALREVVKQALIHATQHGLPGQHHFYITFRTVDEGVQIAPSLRAQYPEEMTIVLQHQFWDLFVDERSFAVTLRFGGKPERLTVPLEAITAFADPAVNFGLQLRRIEAEAADEGEAPLVGEGEGEGEDLEPKADAQPGTAKGTAHGGGEVITLDTFRKK